MRVSIREFSLWCALPAVIVHVWLLLRATWKGKHSPMNQPSEGGRVLDHHTNVTTTAGSSGSDARAEAQYLLNTISEEFYEWEMHCKAPNWRQGGSWEEGFAGLMLDAVYYPTTPGAPLFPHSPSVIYIHVRSAGITLT